MNKLQALRSKAEKQDIDGVELDIKSLTFPELTELAEMMEKKENKAAFNYILFTTLRKSIPKKELNPENGMTDQEIKDEINLMDGNKAMKIVQATQKISGLDSTQKKEGADSHPQNNK